MRPVRIATRASQLALWQANHVAGLLKAAGRESELVEVVTSGDANQTEPLSRLSTSADGGSTGLFTKEVQRAVLDGRADVAVHSLKDLPTVPTPGLTLACVPERADRRDVLVFAAGSQVTAGGFDALPQRAVVGTGSLRRSAQIAHRRPDVDVRPIRGNVDTRLRKLDAGEFDAIVLAAAGLSRLEMGGRPAVPLAPPLMWPAVSQAALGIECREDDADVRGLLGGLSDAAALREVTAERAALRALRAGCHAPVGVWCRAGRRVVLEAVVLSPDGRERVVRCAAGTDAEAVGRAVAGSLLDGGAGAYLETGGDAE